MTKDHAEHPLEDLLDRATTALRDAPIPGGLSPDLVASTVDTLQAVDQQPDVVRPNQRKKLMFRIVRYSSLAAAITLIAVAIGWLFVMDRTAATSLAAVIEQVSQTRSVSFKQTTTEGATSTTEKVVVLAEGLVRTESSGGDYTILDIRQGKSMFVSPSQEQARVFLGFNARMPANFYETFRKLHRTASKRLPDKMIDGRQAVGFVTVMEADGSQAEMTVWVDPKTDLPVRLEADSQGQGGAKHTFTLHDIVFDAQLAPDLFRMEPPEGYAVTTEGIEKMSATKASAANLAPNPGVKVEFRRAENQPGEGLVEAAVPGTPQKIYLHASADVTNADIAEARAALDSQQKPAVEITFTEEGAKKMAQLTAEHRNRPLAILVDGKVIGPPPLAIQVDGQVLGAPVVRDKISQKAQITGNFTQEEVDRIARGINGR